MENLGRDAEAVTIATSQHVTLSKLGRGWAATVAVPAIVK